MNPEPAIIVTGKGIQLLHVMKLRKMKERD
jgi:hypothetical protein